MDVTLPCKSSGTQIRSTHGMIGNGRHYVGICMTWWAKGVGSTQLLAITSDQRVKWRSVQQYCQHNANTGLKNDWDLRNFSNFTFFSKQNSFEKININNKLRMCWFMGKKKWITCKNVLFFQWTRSQRCFKNVYQMNDITLCRSATPEYDIDYSF